MNRRPIGYIEEVCEMFFDSIVREEMASLRYTEYRKEAEVESLLKKRNLWEVEPEKKRRYLESLRVSLQRIGLL